MAAVMPYALMLLGLWFATPRNIPGRYYQVCVIWEGALLAAAATLILLPIFGSLLMPAP